MTDALTTAFMMLGIEEIAALCERSPGLEAWVLPRGGRRPGEAAAPLRRSCHARGFRLGEL